MEGVWSKRRDSHYVIYTIGGLKNEVELIEVV